MNNWIRLFVTKPVATLTLYIFLFIAGLSALFNLPIESEPEIARNELYVSVNYSSSLDAVLHSVAIPLEKKLLAIPGIDLLKADITSNNIQFSLTFTQGSDMNTNMIKLQSAISDARSEIPDNAIVTIPATKEHNDKVISITFSSKHKTIEEINSFVSKFKSNFETIEGVASAIFGNSTNDVCSIMLKPSEMNARNLSFQDVAENMKSFYIQGGSSDITVGNSNIALEIGYDDKQDLRKHPISTQNDSNTYLYEIANIMNEDDSSNFSYRLNGEKVVTLLIYKKQNANLIKICDCVKQKCTLIKPICEANKINLNVIQDKSIFIKNGIHSIYHTILESIILVSIIIYLFLRSFILSAIPILAIPLSIIPTFVLMKAAHVTINVFSLFGIVIAIGLVVDDAIVVIENIHKHIQKGDSKLESSIKGTSQIMLSIISMTLTLAVVYLPILFTNDPYIKAFFDFAFVISVSVIMSGFISITITPMLFNLLYQHEEHSVTTKGLMYKLEYAYLNLLCYLIHNRYVVLYAFTTLSFIAIITLLKLLNYEEEISVDNGYITYHYNYRTDNNLDIKYIDDKLLNFYKTVKSLPIGVDINNIITSVSQNDSSVNYIDIGLVEHKHRKYKIHEITKAIQEALTKEPTDLSIYNMGGNNNMLVVKVNIQVYDDTDYNQLINSVHEFAPLRNIIQDVFTIDVRQNSYYLLTINKDICKLYNVMPHTICETLTSIKKGKYFRESASNEINKISFGIYCTTQEEKLNKILDIPVKGYVQIDNNLVPKIFTLKTFANITTKKKIPKYHRISGNNGMTFTLVLKPGISINDVEHATKLFNKQYNGVAYAEVNITEIRKLESMRNIIKMSLLSVVFIYLLLSALFESFIKPVIILTIVPTSSVGGLLLLYILNLKINTISIIGIITLIGLITKHGIMIIDYVVQHEEDIREPDVLILEACIDRFRPILMTTVCMILGAIPLIIKTNVELIEYKMPISIIIIGGMIVGTCVTLLILPVYYVALQTIIYDKKMLPYNKYIYLINAKLQKYHDTKT